LKAVPTAMAEGLTGGRSASEESVTELSCLSISSPEPRPHVVQKELQKVWRLQRETINRDVQERVAIVMVMCVFWGCEVKI
jgi:hypothetical protein